MRWLRLQWFSISAGLKLWLDEPLGHLFNALVLAIALAMPWTIAQGLSAIVPSMDRWVGDPEISLYFKPDASLDSVKTAAAQLKRDFDLDSVNIVTPEQAMERLRTQSQTPDLAEALPENPLPYTVVVVLEVDTTTNTQAIEDKIAQWQNFTGVEHVQYDAQWVRRLQSVLNGTQIIAVALAVLIAGMVLVVTFNTVRLQLIRNQAEVHVLKSLGATDTEVGRPTLWWSVSLALVAFGLAYAVVSGAMGLADDAAGQFIREFDRDFRFEQPSGITALGLVLVWVVLVMVGAWASVKSTVLRIH
ncbi:MAG: permease-like cell division protein FtsX [Gammaproteobacteria bacterium]|uniref:cell division protein FtsX n=1 Tax=Limnobacter sp. TaxID=2003368 RepID=UPI001D2CF6CA|nr:permease-like cell division protein FtsX [Limnobacter sp.]MBU0783588.1 permease-like cell division protein FtsX [Gammaproteobacteria bacterium]MBU0850321.1 permease-like cell division protein FtsX [Gammaproteobacteria bacterium]MBU1267074.1 permease-like cell division protein FtsX [Gammaproteobacteria bacterium]MBU1529116.1 permease-like cell division protein FtsX [Gammaproteobacteria bacterium]MBU1781658.1 permease-like cell division protein FtsX [Gammaproteobacteria bacterium]